MKMLFSILLLSCCTVNVNAQQIIPLYTSDIPNSKPSPNKETSEINKEGLLILSHVSVPTLTIYRPKKKRKESSAVIICPGGGYGILAAGHEGADVARIFAGWGITAFVLKYRLPDDSIMINKSIAPLQDAQRALQVIRKHAREWNIDASKVGIMGFSAGGHLAAMASVQFDDPVIENPIGFSLRPDFSILIYPVISFTDSLTHSGSRDNLLGKNPTKEMITKYSNELQVTPQTPPAFLVHAGDDDLVPAGNSIAYYEALLRQKIFSELILYPHGGHGFGMNNKTTNDKWMDRLKEWMVSNKFL